MAAHAQVIDLAQAALARGRLLARRFVVDERGELDAAGAAVATGKAAGKAARKVAQVAIWAARRADL
ncbi:MAG: hypothetical protein QJR07_20790, partial [Acetobacteraceae bacterium]|nr:hypothetical protein [Acetobacteraceae bacterium]